MAKIEAAAMARCEVDALTAYLADHKNGSRDEDTLALELTSIVTTKTKLPGGTILVSVSVISRKPWNSENFVFSLQTLGRKVVRKTEKDKPKL